MAEISNAPLSDHEEFYEKRYQEGYMEEWDEDKKNKVRYILKNLNIPESGKVLDFGCGNGVFTNLIKKELPKWEVYGVEISHTAVLNAQRKFPDCHFFTAEEGDKYKNQFDFLFSHHVIEHVESLNDTFNIIDSYLKPHAYQLHILPCRNEGSYEYNISALRSDGINRNLENRFFFEEPGHLRRLNTKEFEEYERRIGFVLKDQFYANQEYGAINWITKSSPRFVKKLTSTENAINEEAKSQLNKLKGKLLPLTYYQFPYSKYWSIKSKWHKKLSDYIKLSVLFLPAQISKLVYNRVEKKSKEEWNEKMHDVNGSEMFLFFIR